MSEEAELIAQAKAGDARAFEYALLPHLTNLLAYSRALCGDYHTAQDVVQETALIAFRNLERFFADADFGTWLKAIARRQALAARRKLGRQRLLAEAALELAYEIEPSDEESRRQAALRECVEHLPGASRELLDARYTEGLSLTEAAGALNANVDTLRWRLYRVRQGLRECVERRLTREDRP
jgi:RNA polymerase sigma-70 factor (ECF subfamily)